MPAHPSLLGRSIRHATLALSLSGSLLATTTAWAEPLTYNIPAGSLAAALSQFAAASGVTISFSSGETSGLQSPGLRGDYELQQGFSQLLQGSGLQIRQAGEKRYVLTRQEAASTLELGATSITGSGLETNTESTGSYTMTSPTSTATKLGLSAKETPQSVSVVTRQRMDDQKLANITDVLEASVGISTFNQGIGTDLDQPYSRGFSVSNYMLDGLPRESGMYSLQTSTALYDRVEIVRGATGLMGGVGSPGASINMIRKRPTLERQASISAEAGSWDHHGLGVDISGPLTEAGNIRSRLVLDHQDQNSWLDRYESRTSLFYNVTEFDLSDSTMLSIGLSHQRNDNEAPMRSGVPLYYANGAKINLPRSYNNAPDWSFYDLQQSNLFVAMDHQFDNGWTGKMELSHTQYEQNAVSYYQYGEIDPATGLGSSITAAKWVQPSRTSAFDGYLTGPFSLFGREHELVTGMAASHKDMKSENYNWLYSWNSTYDGTLGDIWQWDGSGANRPNFDMTGKTDTEETQYSAYLTSRFNLTDATHLILGSRVMDWRRDSETRQATGLRSKQSKKESGVVVPFAGLVYDLNDVWALYGSYTQIFNPQGAAVRDINNAPLDPEEGTAYEVGIKAGFDEARINASLALFRSEQDNVAELDGTTGFYRTLQGITTKGVELEANGELTEGWNVFGGYAYSVSEDAQGKRAMSRIPRHSLKGFTTYRLAGPLDKFTLGGGFNWKSRFGFEGEGFPEQKSYVVLDAMTRYDISRQLSATLNVSNLLDKKYFASVTENGVYGEPRNAVLSLKYSF